MGHFDVAFPVGTEVRVRGLDYSPSLRVMGGVQLHMLNVRTAAFNNNEVLLANQPQPGDAAVLQAVQRFTFYHLSVANGLYVLSGDPGTKKLYNGMCLYNGCFYQVYSESYNSYVRYDPMCLLVPFQASAAAGGVFELRLYHLAPEYGLGLEVWLADPLVTQPPPIAGMNVHQRRQQLNQAKDAASSQPASAPSPPPSV